MKGLFAAVAIIAVAALTISCSTKQQAAAEKPAEVKGAKVERVAASSIDDYYEAVGTVRSKTMSVLSAKIMGRVIAVHAREGDRVRAGQLLIEIDSSDATAMLDKAQAGEREATHALEEIERTIHATESSKEAAEANLTLATATFNRYKALLERRSVSRQEFDEVQARKQVAETEVERADRMLQSLEARRSQALAKIAQAKADVANAKVYVGYAKITSPINGIVTSKQTDVGHMATPGAPLMTIEDGASYRLEASVEESLLPKIRVGTKARVLIDALGPSEFSGAVSEIVPAADSASRSYTVRIDVEGSQSLWSGLYGKARFIMGQKQALTIPRQAIVERGQLVGVFVVDESNIARLRLIKTGKQYGERVEILSGLSEGERILIDHVESVSDGSLVQQAAGTQKEKKILYDTRLSISA
ncbi:MAG TPA: efflux RND transporter periplasmic adaptor subunit [Blastocatellia bacterium]|nr:efflux RND transporter periplasmic adaptor subunit [Blastocatellia bacterium]